MYNAFYMHISGKFGKKNPKSCLGLFFAAYQIVELRLIFLSCCHILKYNELDGNNQLSWLSLLFQNWIFYSGRMGILDVIFRFEIG